MRCGSRREKWIRALVADQPSPNVPGLRKLRRRISAELAADTGLELLNLAECLLRKPDVPRWLVYEIVHEHPGAMEALDLERLTHLGAGMASWGEVDAFAVHLAGVAWREGRISGRAVRDWARSPDRWWRRAALVSTVPLNVPARGGAGDAPRTLAVCSLLRDDRDDMVVKALSWALRALAPRDPRAVRAFLDTHRHALAPRVLREVSHKLETGVKAPDGGRGPA